MPVQLKIIGIYPPVGYLDKTYKEFEQEVEKELRGPIKRRGIDAFQERVKGWSVAPQFVGLYTTFQGAVGALTIYPRGKGRDRWAWVSFGVHGHTITPKRAVSLRVRLGYVPKTLPNDKLTGGPGVYIGDTIFTQQVEWPGIEPRHFEEEIKKEIEGEVISRLVAVAKRVFK